jgi:hypothetical protein
MSLWDSNIWDFDDNSLPHLTFENYFSLSASTGLSSLFPFGSIFIPLMLVLSFLFVN